MRKARGLHAFKIEVKLDDGRTSVDFRWDRRPADEIARNAIADSNVISVHVKKERVA